VGRRLIGTQNPGSGGSWCKEDRFPKIWVPDAENRDLRQLLRHRHRLVQMRTRVMNQLHVVALNEGLRRKKALWRPVGRAELAGLSLGPWASRRRQDLLDLLDRLTPKIQELTGKLEQIVERRPRDATTEHASRSGPADRTGIRVRDGDVTSTMKWAMLVGSRFCGVRYRFLNSGCICGRQALLPAVGARGSEI